MKTLRLALLVAAFPAALLLGEWIGNTYADHQFGGFRQCVERNRIELERFQAERAEEIRQDSEWAQKRVDSAIEYSTLQAYDSLPLGATLADATERLGPGIEANRLDSRTGETSGYLFKGRFALVFHNGRLISKQRLQ